ncbi:hypothetical protein [Streptomyces monashensis]|uniref:hypothetical protein n=1 Tax=Streptomyces monashensis TaxID=1678012 RepID=UPI000AEE9B27|nr:hypothetical protein [Streptomyces monashensis]
MEIPGGNRPAGRIGARGVDGPRYHPRPRDPEEVIGLVGLETGTDSRTKTLSGDERRRLDVALGVIGGPEPLLLDDRPPAPPRPLAAGSGT